MNEPATRERSRFAVLARILVRALIVTLCVAILTVCLFISSRYQSNRRLMAIYPPVKSSDVDVDVVFGWKGPTSDLLESWIGSEAATALLCRPTSLLVFGHDKTLTDAKVLDLLQFSLGLEEIEIYVNDLPSGSLEMLANCHRLRRLYFCQSTISQNDAGWLSRMTQLSSVGFVRSRADTDGTDWSWIESLPNLETLRVKLVDATRHDLRELTRCDSLLSLHLSGGDIPDELLLPLCDRPKLAVLCLEDTPVHLHFSGRKLPPSLKILELQSTDIDDESLRTIDGLPNLHSISIKGGRITDTGLETLSQLPSLGELKLEELKNITHEGLRHLTSSTSLTHVSIRRCSVGPADWLNLESVPDWQWLNTSGVFYKIDDVVYKSHPKVPNADSGK